VIRERKTKGRVGWGKGTFDDSSMFIGCKTSMGKNENDIQGKFRKDF
jgi:hypothetical protein